MRYKALTPINHDNTRYEIGDAMDLSDAEAAPLIESKAIEPFTKPFAKEFSRTALHSNTQGE